MDINKYAGLLMAVNTIDVLAGIVVAVVLAKTKEKDKTSSVQINSLQTQLNSSKEKCESIEKELKKKIEEPQDLSPVVDKLKKEIEIKNNSLADLQNNCKQKENQINSLQEELKAAKAEFTAAEKEFQETKKKGSDLNKELLRQKDSCKEFNSGIERLKKEALEFKEKLDGKEKELSQTLAKLSALEAELKNKSADIQALKAETENQKNTIAEFKNKDKENENKIVFLNNELKAVKDKCDSEIHTLKAENEKKADLNIQIGKLKSEIEAQIKTIAEFGNKDTEQLNQIKSLHAELKTTKDNCIVAETEFKRKSEELRALKTEAEKKDSENADLIDTLQKDLKATKDNYIIAEKEYKRKSEEIQSLKAENIKIGDLIHQLAELKKEIENQNNTITEFSNKGKESAVEINLLKKENLEFEDRLSGKEEELRKLSDKYLSADKELKSKIEEIRSLKSENAKVRELTVQSQKSNKEIDKANKLIEELKKENKKLSESVKQEQPQTNAGQDVSPYRKNKKIGEILIQENFITREMLNEALQHQEKYGGTVTKFLIGYGYIDEVKLAQCLCHQFGVPYLPLSSYEISEEIIKLVPIDIAEKYWLIPVQKVGASLTIIMADPFDYKAISTVEKITGCKVQPFVGILSDIIQALESYYKVIINENDAKGKKTIPCFITTEAYKGLERRQWTRFNVGIDIYFPLQGRYNKSLTKDVSRGGFLFEAEVPLEIGSTIPLQVDLPKNESFWPILSVVQVIRIQSLQNGKFDVATKIVKISKEEIDMIVKYAMNHKKA